MKLGILERMKYDKNHKPNIILESSSNIPKTYFVSGFKP